jgi:hypothetical protein
MFDHSGQQIMISATNLVVIKVKQILSMSKQRSHRFYVERLAMNKQSSHKFHMDRFSLKKLNKVEGKGEVSCEGVK